MTLKYANEHCDFPKEFLIVQHFQNVFDHLTRFWCYFSFYFLGHSPQTSALENLINRKAAVFILQCLKTAKTKTSISGEEADCVEWNHSKRNQRKHYLMI